MQCVDSLVIGGGPAGATTAILLAKAGWSVIVLERARFPRRKVCGEYLSAGSLPLLDRLGIGEAFRKAAGPPVTHVGLFTGNSTLVSPLPRVGSVWGRALARERLDSLLLARARDVGADVRQPCVANTLSHVGDGWVCEATSGADELPVAISAHIVVAAHGSWETGDLPTHARKRPPRASDLFGFKARFVGARLAPGLMPLLAFPGGYGGMVHVGDADVSLSCCVRRDRLRAIRAATPGDAGEAVQAHIERSCRGVREALATARRDGSWLAIGPVRPGPHPRAPDGIFCAGNAAGEAHPVIAEGISMAIQGAALLVHRLLPCRASARLRPAVALARVRYARDWRRAFRVRLVASTAIASWAMRANLVRTTVPLVRAAPRILTWGARLAGKAARTATSRTHRP